MYVENAIFPVVTEIMSHLGSLPDTNPRPSEIETRAVCFKAMRENEIFEPLTIEQESVLTLLVHKRANYQTCYAIWAFFVEQSAQLEETIEPKWEAWPIAA